MEKGEGCPEEVLRRFPTYPEIREYVLRVGREPITLSRSVGRRALVRDIIKIDRVSEYLARNVLGPLRSLSNVLSVEFYRQLASNVLPEGANVLDLVGRASGMFRAALRLSREYKSRIAVSVDSVEAKELYREYVGRILSIVRRSFRDLEQLNRAVAELRRTPCVDPSIPVVAVAGLPQVGKSTLVSAVSTAKPRTSPFPFTTKEIVMGHVELGPLRFQILDLPGILDRPPEEMNEIERRAFIAVTSLADLVLFLVDPSEDFYYGLESQLRLLRSLREWVRVDVVVAINKVDKVGEERVDVVSKSIAATLPGARILRISALKRAGLGELLRTLAEHLGLSWTGVLPEGVEPEDQHRDG